MSLYKCPHCGWVYDPEKHEERHMFVPDHGDGPPVISVLCPGSGQHPRNAESDKRPLWSEE